MKDNVTVERELLHYLDALKMACPSGISDRLEFLDFSPPVRKHRRHAQLDTRSPWNGSRVLEVALTLTEFYQQNSRRLRHQFGRGV